MVDSDQIKSRMIDKDHVKSRPEAQAFGIDKLNKSQRAALKKLLEKLEWACEDIKNRSKDNTEKSNLRWTIKIPKNNPNRVFFLTGGRGCGKTSVLFSLINLLREKCTDDSPLNVKNLQNKLIWLEPLEMETLPSSTNLLAAILSRVDMAIDRFRCHHPTLHEPRHSFGMHPEEQETLLNFMKLQQDVALAWDGNIEKRAGSMDPDVYALEVLRAEQKRINLNERIEKTLDDLCDKFIPYHSENGNPCIFVLPVDDFDMNPERCFELIRMIRMFNIPRLYTIILGDERILSHQLNIHFLKSLIKSDTSSQPILFSNDISYKECQLSHELSANALRKLFAPGNRISLGAMDKEEVFVFSNNTEKTSINELLQNFNNITLNTAYQVNNNETKFQIIAGQKFDSVIDLFNLKIDTLINIDQKIKAKLKINVNIDEYIYVGKHLFILSARHTHDLWNYLYCEYEKKNKSKIGDDKKISFSEKQLFKFAKYIFDEKIREGEALTMRSHGRLNSILKNDFSGDMQLTTTDLEFVYNYGQSIRIPQRETSIGIHHPKDWETIIKETMFQQDRSKDRRDVKLMDTTASGIIFLHDLLAFSYPKKITGEKFLHQETPPLWAYTQWNFGGKEKNIKIAWPFPHWLTMFECDILRRSWVRVWQWVGYVKREHTNEKLKKTLAEYLPYAWMKIITGILAGPEVYNDRFVKLIKSNNFDFNKAKEDIEKLIPIIQDHIDKKNTNSAFYSVLSERTDKDLKSDINELIKLKTFIVEFFANKPLSNRAFHPVECFDNLKLLINKLVNYSHQEFEKDSTEQLFNIFKLLILPTDSEIQDVSGGTTQSLLKDDDWTTLIEEIEMLIDDGENQYERRQRLIRSWISNVACMMAPEYDLPENIQIKFNELINNNPDSKIQKLLERPEIKNDIRNLRAKNAAHFLNNNAFKKIRELFFSPPYSYPYPYSSPPPYKAFVIFNDLRFCPYIDTIFTNSEKPRGLQKTNEERMIKFFNGLKDELMRP